jgi:hypothetical protein
MTTRKKTEGIGQSAAQRVSEHAQGFVFGLIVGVCLTAGLMWAVVEPIIR